MEHASAAFRADVSSGFVDTCAPTKRWNRDAWRALFLWNTVVDAIKAAAPFSTEARKFVSRGGPYRGRLVIFRIQLFLLWFWGQHACSNRKLRLFCASRRDREVNASLCRYVWTINGRRQLLCKLSRGTRNFSWRYFCRNIYSYLENSKKNGWKCDTQAVQLTATCNTLV